MAKSQNKKKADATEAPAGEVEVVLDGTQVLNDVKEEIAEMIAEHVNEAVGEILEVVSGTDHEIDMISQAGEPEEPSGDAVEPGFFQKDPVWVLTGTTPWAWKGDRHRLHFTLKDEATGQEWPFPVEGGYIIPRPGDRFRYVRHHSAYSGATYIEGETYDLDEAKRIVGEPYA